MARRVDRGVAVAIAVSLPLAGHADTHSPRGLLIATDVLHVLAAGAWLGGLLALLALFWPRGERDSDDGLRATAAFSAPLPAYAERPQAAAARARNTVSYDLSPWGLNLPSGFNMTRPLVARVCAALKTLLRDAR